MADATIGLLVTSGMNCAQELARIRQRDLDPSPLPCPMSLLWTYKFDGAMAVPVVVLIKK